MANPRIYLWIAVALLQVVHPQPHPQRQVFALRKHCIDAIGRGGKVVENGHQGAGGHLAFYLPGGAPRDAQACQAPVVQHLAVAAVEPAVQAQVRQGAVDREGPAAGLAGVGAEGEAVVLRQVVGVVWCARTRQVLRRGHAQPAVVGQAHADQAAVGQVAHAHRAVEAFVDDVDHPVAQVQ